MGDRANIKFVTNQGPPMYFYAHWAGSEIPDILADALERGQGRWDDPQYLARIIFCEMIKGDPMGETGYGLSTFLGDGDDRVWTVDADLQTVTDPSERVAWGFPSFIKDRRTPA